MENIVEVSSPGVEFSPSFSDVRNPPKSVGEGAWIVAMLAVPVILFYARELISVRISAIKAESENKIAEDKQELAQRDALIKHLQEQNNMFINEIMILRRTMDYSGDFTPKDKQIGR